MSCVRSLHSSNSKNHGPYDLIFSNFAGLNCTPELGKVFDSFSFLLKPGGFVTLVVLPKFCLWEFLLLFKGKFRTAFRRFSGKRGSNAKVEGQPFHCWYYNPSFIKKRMRQQYSLVKQEGLCTLVPPSYMEDLQKNIRPGITFFKKQKIEEEPAGRGKALETIISLPCKRGIERIHCKWNARLQFF